MELCQIWLVLNSRGVLKGDLFLASYSLMHILHVVILILEERRNGQIQTLNLPSLILITLNFIVVILIKVPFLRFEESKTLTFVYQWDILGLWIYHAFQLQVIKVTASSIACAIFIGALCLGNKVRWFISCIERLNITSFACGRSIDSLSRFL